MINSAHIKNSKLIILLLTLKPISCKEKKSEKTKHHVLKVKDFLNSGFYSGHARTCTHTHTHTHTHAFVCFGSCKLYNGALKI